MRPHTLKELKNACNAAIERADMSGPERREDDWKCYRPPKVRELDQAVLELMISIENDPHYRQVGS